MVNHNVDKCHTHTCRLKNVLSLFNNFFIKYFFLEKKSTPLGNKTHRATKIRPDVCLWQQISGTIVNCGI